MALDITDIPQEFRDVAALCNATDVLIGGRIVVGIADARDLHAGLGVGRDFTSWIKGRIEKFGFREGVDFVVSHCDGLAKQSCSPVLVSKIVSRNVAQEGVAQPFDFIDHQNGGTIKSTTYDGAKTASRYSLSLQMAKELAMVENNDQGRRIRRYYIWLEEALHAKATPKTEASNKPSLLDLETAREWLAIAREAGQIAGPDAARSVLERSPLLQTGDFAGTCTVPVQEKRPAKRPTRYRLSHKRRVTDGEIDHFLADCTYPLQNSRIAATLLYRMYTGWCAREGIVPKTVNAFGRSCRRRLETVKNSSNLYLGIGPRE